MNNLKTIILVSISLLLSSMPNYLKAEPITVILSTHAEEDRRAAAEALAQAREEQRRVENEIFTRLAAKGGVPHDRAIRGRYYDWLKQNRKFDEDVKRISAVDSLQDGDQVRLTNAYDDTATIKIYLHDSGYAFSDAEIKKISAYMTTNHIHHISELF
jgi:hypothetical protein